MAKPQSQKQPEYKSKTNFRRIISLKLVIAMYWVKCESGFSDLKIKKSEILIVYKKN